MELFLIQEEIILKKYELLTTLEIENNMINTLIPYLKQQLKMLQTFIQIINPKLLKVNSNGNNKTKSIKI